MTESANLEWTWLASGAIDEFKQWRIQAGATTASASSYATGARTFVRYCRGIDLNPIEAIETFHDHLARSGDLSAPARSDYRSHARAFVRFLQSTRSGTRMSGLQHPEAVSSPPGEAERSISVISSTGDAVAVAETVGAPTPREAEVAQWLDSYSDASTAELLAGYARTLEVLRTRGVLRTANAPVGDFAEWLVWRGFGGTIEPNSTKSHDVTDALGRKLQVKARLVSQRATPGQLQTSVFRSWTFDFAVLVQLAERDYSVVRASMVPVHLFDEGHANAKWSEHVKGWAVFMTPALMSHPDAVDVTAQLRLAAEAG